MKAAEAHAIARLVDYTGTLLKEIDNLISMKAKMGHFSTNYIFYSETPQNTVDKVIKKLTDDGYKCVIKYEGVPKYWYEIKW